MRQLQKLFLCWQKIPVLLQLRSWLTAVYGASCAYKSSDINDSKLDIIPGLAFGV